VSNTIRVYNALRHSGIKEEDAAEITNAIEEVQDKERLGKIEDGLRSVEDKQRDHDAEFKLQRWMIGFNIALSVAVLVQVIFMH
jgi:hypothetical protein